MKQLDLNGEEIKEAAPMTEEEQKDDGKNAMSAWVKEIRLGNTTEAVKWAWECLKHYDAKHIMRRMLVNSFEDTVDPAFQAACQAGWTCVCLGDTNPIPTLTVEACRAKKIWEDPEARDAELYGVLSSMYEEKNKIEINWKLPSYAKDMHCKAGYEMMKRIGSFDERISGMELGIWYRSWLGKNGERLSDVVKDLPEEEVKAKMTEVKQQFEAWLAKEMPGFVKGLRGSAEKTTPPTEMTKKSDNVYSVQSFTDKRVAYDVTVGEKIDSSTCSCPAFQRGIRVPCKHIVHVWENKV